MMSRWSRESILGASRTWARIGIVAAALLTACGSGETGSTDAPDASPPAAEAPAPADASVPDLPPPTAWEGLSTRGAYHLRVRPEEPPIPLGRIHRWLVEVENAQGEPVAIEAMSVGGGMPQHGHGFVTEPEATPGPAGEVVIDGMKFHMAGAWRLDLGIMGPHGFDAISFDIQVGP